MLSETQSRNAGEMLKSLFELKHLRRFLNLFTVALLIFFIGCQDSVMDSEDTEPTTDKEAMEKIADEDSSVRSFDEFYNEIFRKYPATKKQVDSRIYFANLLYEFGLYEEAYDDFISIKELKLSDKEKKEVGNNISLLNKKLVNK